MLNENDTPIVSRFINEGCLCVAKHRSASFCKYTYHHYHAMLHYTNFLKQNVMLKIMYHCDKKVTPHTGFAN